MLFLITGIIGVSLIILSFLLLMLTRAEEEMILKFLVGGFMLAVASFLAAGIGSSLPHKSEMKFHHSVNIVASKDDSQLQGRFGLFSGYIDTNAYYVYYYKLPDGGYKRGEVLASKTTIIESKTATPHVSLYEDTNCDPTWYGFPSCADTTYKIIVPPDTIIRQYKFNLGD